MLIMSVSRIPPRAPRWGASTTACSALVACPKRRGIDPGSLTPDCGRLQYLYCDLCRSTGSRMTQIPPAGLVLARPPAPITDDTGSGLCRWLVSGGIPSAAPQLGAGVSGCWAAAAARWRVLPGTVPLALVWVSTGVLDAGHTHEYDVQFYVRIHALQLSCCAAA